MVVVCHLKIFIKFEFFSKKLLTSITFNDIIIMRFAKIGLCAGVAQW